MSLTGKTAIVTGGSRGIGRAVCLELARRGCNIVLSFAGNTAAADQTVSDCQALGVQALAVQGNVADADAVKALFDAALEKFGAIDILVNNAGITRDALLVSMKEADFDAVIAINLKGVFNTIHACYHHFMRKRSGRIINISSVTGLMGNPGQANYTAAKAGIIGLTKTTAKELASRGVTCNAIAPGFIQTAMTDVLSDKAKKAMLDAVPMKRMGQPEDIAKTALYLASDLSSYVTGEVIRVDGGMCM